MREVGKPVSAGDVTKALGAGRKEVDKAFAELQEAMKTIEFPFYDDPKQQIENDYEPTAIKQLSELAAAFSDDYGTTCCFYVKHNYYVQRKDYYCM